MVTYPVTRFLIEYLRNDEGVFFAGMTISQNISVVAARLRPRCSGTASAAGRRRRYADTAEADRRGDRSRRSPADRGGRSGDRDVVEDAAEEVVGGRAPRRRPRS